jgi:GDPmannose 4,6-dehydratase
MTQQKRALITGITGQDGMYLAELLLDKSYQVYGLIRGQNNPKRAIVEAEIPAVELIEGDLTDMSSLVNALELSQPDEVYNLAAISFVAFSFKQPETTGNVTGLGALRLLEAVRRVDGGKGRIRYYQASTSELYGKVRETPQTELTPFHPRSPYGVAKAYAHHMTVNYRESYNLHASCGILFNHESPRRGYEFVTRKVTSSVARIKLGLQQDLALGNLEAKRDWGFAGDYVKGMWLMLQQDKPDDYVLATGETHPISELLDLAFAEVGITDWKPYVKQDPRFMRPAEVDLLHGDPSKAKKKLDWKPEVGFKDLVAIMVQNDLEIEGVKAKARR